MAYSDVGADVRATAPAAEGFRFPAEWERHEATLMQFPPAQNWPAAKLRGARPEWAAVANAVAAFEPVKMIVSPQDRSAADKLLSSDIGRIELPLNDGWSRDSGPMILVNDAGDRRIAGFGFNGWGRKFEPCRDDALLKARIAARWKLPIHASPLVLEGGAVHVDGDGTALTTERCLLNPNRNEGWTKEQVEAELKGWLGVETVIWLPDGIVPDPITDGHVDGIAAFAAPGKVLLHTCDDPGDPNTQITGRAREILEGTRDARGRRIEVIEMPMTSADVLHMNFYICNGGVIVPVTGRSEQDDAPLGLLREVFPDHEVVPVTGRFMAQGGGGVHCITQQVPATQAL